MYTVQRIIRGGYKIQRNNVFIRSLCSKDIIDMPETSGVTIPPYVEKKDETMAVRKARLIYQSRKRGMLENDLLLSTFASKYLEGMNMEQLSIYDQLINQPSNEWDLYYWAIGNKPIPDEFKSEIMDMLVEHAKNRNKEKRMKQPNLY